MVCRYFSSLDFLAPEVGLGIHGKSGVQTKVGSFMFLAASAVFIWSIVISSKEFFRTDKPTITYETTIGAEYPRIDISKGFMPPMILATKNAGTAIPYEELQTYVTVVASHYFVDTIAQPDKSFKTTYTKKNVQVIPCKQIIDNGTISMDLIKKSLTTFATSFYENGICLDASEENSYVEGRYNDPHFVGFNFEFYPCSLGDLSKCRSKEDVESFGIIYLTGQESLNLGYYEQPLSYSFNGDEFYYIDVGLYKQSTMKVMQVEIWDERDIIQPESLRISYPKIEQSFPEFSSRDATQTTCTKEQIQNFECRPYFGRYWISGGTNTKITRSYKSIVETVGDIGGARDTIFMIAMLLYGWYNERCKKYLLLEEVFGIQGTKSGPGESKSAKQLRLKAEDKAYDSIEATLDVVALAKEIHSFRMLARILLQDQQIELLNKAALSTLLSESDSSETQKTGKVTSSVANSEPNEQKQCQAQNWAGPSLSPEDLPVIISSVGRLEQSRGDLDVPDELDFQGPPKQVRNSVDPQPRDPNDWPSSEEGLIQRLQAEFDTIISKCLEENQDMIKRLTNPDTSNSGAPGDPRVGTTLSNPKPAPFHPLEVGSPQ